METHTRTHERVTYCSARHMSQGSQAPVWGEKEKITAVDSSPASLLPSALPAHAGATGFPHGSQDTAEDPVLLLPSCLRGHPLLQSLRHQGHHLPRPTSAPLPRLGPCLECPLSCYLCMKNLSHPSLECCLKVPSARRPLPSSTTPSPHSPILRDRPLSEHIFIH